MMNFPILITSAGRRVALMRCLKQSAEELGLNPRLIAAEMNSKLSAAAHWADTVHTVSRCTAPGYIDELIRIARLESAKLLIPTIDTELPSMASAKSRLTEAGLHVSVSSPQVVALARDKVAFMAFCENVGVLVPQTTLALDFLNKPTFPALPVIFKPIAGSRSIGIVRAFTASEIPELDRPEDYMVQELWKGREFTVNIFIGRDGLLKCAVPHERLEVRDGEVAKGVTRRIPSILSAAQRIGDALGAIGAYGPLCFQGILCEDGSFAVFELNARFGGGYPLAHNAGAHFTRWLMEDALGKPTTAADHWLENRLMLRYDDAVFADEA